MWEVNWSPPAMIRADWGSAYDTASALRPRTSTPQWSLDAISPVWPARLLDSTTTSSPTSPLDDPLPTTWHNHREYGRDLRLEVSTRLGPVGALTADSLSLSGGSQPYPPPMAGSRPDRVRTTAGRAVGQARSRENARRRPRPLRACEHTHTIEHTRLREHGALSWRNGVNWWV